MSESGDYKPMVWTDHNFSQARQHYDQHVGRSYADAQQKGKTTKDVLPRSLTTQSTAPLVVLVDETGSMGEWPKTIFSKLPYLYNEASTEYLGPDVEISFGAVGDAHNNEAYPAQARPFEKGKDLKQRLEELVIEASGGGQMHESYELLALYYARNVHMPKAIQPILIMIGDEMPWDHMTKEMAKSVFVDIEDKHGISTEQIFAEVKAKYSFYLILKPYCNGAGGDDDRNSLMVKQGWLKYVDDDHIAYLADPTRVVDVIFGILAKETGKISYFKKEIEDRQKPGQVATTYKALATIHQIAGGKVATPSRQLKAGNSTMFRRGGKTKKSDDLI